MRLWTLAASSLLAFTISGLLTLPHLSTPEMTGDSDFSVGQFNVYHNNPIPQDAIAALAQNAPDIFTIRELNSEWKSTIDSLVITTHPYHIEEYWDNCCYGIGVYSKHPFTNYRVFDIAYTPLIIAEIDVSGRLITVVSLHTRPPAFPDQKAERNLQLKAVTSIASAETTDLIVLGDFNVVPWDGVFKDFLKTSELARAYSGFNATYPMDLGIPLIPIDHICFSEHFVPKECYTVVIPGSDHKGIVAVLDIRN